MNDSEFIKEFSPELYKHYCKAKQVYSDAPDLSLVCIRSYVNGLCALLYNTFIPKGEQTNFYYRIRDLVRKRGIYTSVADALRDIQQDGNKGAHSEQFKDIDFNLFQELAYNNLQRCCELTEKIYLSLKNEAAPTYTFEDPLQDSIKDICYEATMNSDPEAQYFVGLSLKSKADVARKQEIQDAVDTNSVTVKVDLSERLLKHSQYWFKQAASNHHTKAMFEYGYALLLAGSPEEKNSGIPWIEKAAADGYDSALAKLGHIYLYGTHALVKDEKLAVEYLEKAAVSEHPEALTTLGAMYLDGIAMEVNHKKGFEYSYKGAVAGYPEAQYNLSQLYFSGKGAILNNREGLRWLQKSADQGCSEAIALMAFQYLNEDICPVDTEKSYNLYLDAIRHNNLEAMLEFALLCGDNHFLKKDHLVDAANYLQLCYENSSHDMALREKAYTNSPNIIKKLRQLLTSGNLSGIELDNVFLMSTLFDQKGYPYPDRNAQITKLSERLSNHVKQKKTVKKKIAPGDGRKIGRNELCPCGSGKKYKKCCQPQ